MGGEFQYDRTFDLDKIVGLRSEEEIQRVKVSVRDYCVQLLQSAKGADI